MSSLPENPSAKEIGAYLLDCTGRSILAGHFEHFAMCFTTTHEIGSFSRRKTLNNAGELEAIFHRLCATYTKMGVTDIVRNCIEASFEDETTVKFVYETRLLNGTTLIRGPYPNFCVARKEDGRWKIFRSEYAVEQQDTLSAALFGDDLSSPDGTA